MYLYVSDWACQTINALGGGAFGVGSQRGNCFSIYFKPAVDLHQTKVKRGFNRYQKGQTREDMSFDLLQTTKSRLPTTTKKWDTAAKDNLAMVTLSSWIYLFIRIVSVSCLSVSSSSPEQCRPHRTKSASWAAASGPLCSPIRCIRKLQLSGGPCLTHEKADASKLKCCWSDGCCLGVLLNKKSYPPFPTSPVYTRLHPLPPE